MFQSDFLAPTMVLVPRSFNHRAEVLRASPHSVFLRNFAYLGGACGHAHADQKSGPGKRRGRSTTTASSSHCTANALYDCDFRKAVRRTRTNIQNGSRPKTANMSKDTMKAVVFHGKLDVRLEDRPVPKIIDPTDVIVKVRYTALCGR
jgi:hypothetical protein